MSDHDRFLLTFDSARGTAVKVERVGKDGDLTEVNLADFLGLLTPRPDAAAALQPINININFYQGKGAPAVAVGGSPSHPLPSPGTIIGNRVCNAPYCYIDPKEEEKKT